MSVCKSWLCIDCGKSAQILQRMDFVYIMADEYTDVANKELIVICIMLGRQNTN